MNTMCNLSHPRWECLICTAGRAKSQSPRSSLPFRGGNKAWQERTHPGATGRTFVSLAGQSVLSSHWESTANVQQRGSRSRYYIVWVKGPGTCTRDLTHVLRWRLFSPNETWCFIKRSCHEIEWWIKALSISDNEVYIVMKTIFVTSWRF